MSNQTIITGQALNLHGFLARIQDLAEADADQAMDDLGSETIHDYLQELIDGEAINEIAEDARPEAPAPLARLAREYLRTLQTLTK